MSPMKRFEKNYKYDHFVVTNFEEGMKIEFYWDGNPGHTDEKFTKFIQLSLGKAIYEIQKKRKEH
jgi:hypothetical protein